MYDHELKMIKVQVRDLTPIESEEEIVELIIEGEEI